MKNELITSWLVYNDRLAGLALIDWNQDNSIGP